MKEALVILLVFAVLIGLTAFRYRRQIGSMVRVWRMFKSMRETSKLQRPDESAGMPVNAGPLVNCAKCGTWVPQAKAIKLRGNTFYCSSVCLETAVEAR